METTIDLPDHILHRAQAVAVKRRVTVEELVLKGLEYELARESVDVDSTEDLVAALSIGRNRAPIGRLNRDEIYDRPIFR